MHKKIDVAEDAGFAITLIPPSDSGPHMAKGGEDRYYKRSGCSFIRMEHFDVEDMFGRRARPRLDLTTRIVKGDTKIGEALGFKVIIGIQNTGRGSARAPYLSLEVSGPCKVYEFGLDGNRHEGLPRLPSASNPVTRHAYGAGGDTYIHPGTTRDVLALSGKFDPGAKGFTDLVVDYQVAADGCRVKCETLVIPASKLIASVRNAWK